MHRLNWVPVAAILLATGCLPWMDPDPDDRCPSSMPTQGDFCTGSQACTFGPEACQCGTCVPAFGCQCVGGSWQCWHTDPLNCDDVDAVSPDVAEPCPYSQPEDLSVCPSEGQSCSWGPMACQCDLPCHPAYGCDCISGQWRCWHTDPMQCPEVWEDVPPAEVIEDVRPDNPPGCPAEPPIGVWAGCEANLTCEYGTECCCGQCYPSMVCTCMDGTWGCYATDACMIPGCPDVYEDVMPEPSQDVPPWETWEVSVDTFEFWSQDVPVPACCAKNADCGPGMSCGSGDGGHGTCKTALPWGECWSLEDCPTGSTCQGAFVCPCNADCFGPDVSGTCVPLPSACCWVDGDCDAGQVCRGQGGIGGLPGSCVDDPAGPSCVGDSACCWNDGDCPKGTACGNVSVCGCIELCPMCGQCAPDRMGTCG